jgi:hypothetical protein
MMITGIEFNLQTAALLVMVVVLAAVCLWQRREIRMKNRTLARLIKENLRYKFPRTSLGTQA